MNGHTASLAAPEIQEGQIRYLGDLQRLELKPGEVLVLTVDEIIDERTAEMLRVYVQRAVSRPGFVPDVLVLERGLKLGVLSCPAR